MKNTKDAQKLKIIAKEKGKKAIHIAWKSKPSNSQQLMQIYMNPSVAEKSCD